MKQVILVRTDLRMDKGKMAAQVAHASVEATLQSDHGDVEDWRMDGMKKIVLKVGNIRELVKFHKLAKQHRLVSALITDAGHTFFKRPTKTCVGIGPADEGEIDAVTGDLSMY